MNMILTSLLCGASFIVGAVVAVAAYTFTLRKALHSASQNNKANFEVSNALLAARNNMTERLLSKVERMVVANERIAEALERPYNTEPK